MPKYQIILQSNEQIDSGELEAIARRWVNACEVRFDILEARNLEGIRKELWQSPPKPALPDFTDLL